MRAHLILLVCLGLVGFPLPAFAQWASATQLSRGSLKATYANGSGFSAFTTGDVNYSGPLNVVSEGQVPPTLSITLNGSEVVNGVVVGIAETLPPSAAYPRLSPELGQAQVAVGDNSVIKTGVGETLPLVVEAGVSQMQLSLESVDGQSLSVYPALRPSLQLPRESGLYNEADNPNNPNAANAGPTVVSPSGSPL
jgi:hypothetical protein